MLVYGIILEEATCRPFFVPRLCKTVQRQRQDTINQSHWLKGCCGPSFFCASLIKLSYYVVDWSECASVSGQDACMAEQGAATSCAEAGLDGSATHTTPLHRTRTGDLGRSRVCLFSLDAWQRPCMHSRLTRVCVNLPSLITAMPLRLLRSSRVKRVKVKNTIA